MRKQAVGKGQMAVSSNEQHAYSQASMTKINTSADYSENINAPEPLLLEV